MGRWVLLALDGVLDVVLLTALSLYILYPVPSATSTRVVCSDVNRTQPSETNVTCR